MTVVIARGYAWIAEKDRVAHAHIARGRHTRTLCDRPALDPRYAFPAAVRCAECTAAIDGKEGAPIAH